MLKFNVELYRLSCHGETRRTLNFLPELDSSTAMHRIFAYMRERFIISSRAQLGPGLLRTIAHNLILIRDYVDDDDADHEVVEI